MKLSKKLGRIRFITLQPSGYQISILCSVLHRGWVGILYLKKVDGPDSPSIFAVPVSDRITVYSDKSADIPKLLRRATLEHFNPKLKEVRKRLRGDSAGDTITAEKFMKAYTRLWEVQGKRTSEKTP